MVSQGANVLFLMLETPSPAPSRPSQESGKDVNQGKLTMPKSV